jgi:hypothetical protein
MNERIKELLQNKPVPIGSIGNWGRVEWDYNVYPQLGDQLYAGVDLQKFAEAIVKECAVIIAQCKDQAIDEDWNVDEAMSNVEMDLKDHFGIE